jgi:V8-like Glu-specific endopeptidase
MSVYGLRRLPRWKRWLVAVSVFAALPAVPASGDTMPQASPFDGMAPVGALFTTSPSGKLAHHFCSASVVNSPGGDLVITAAHCLLGRAPSRVAFVPGYAGQGSPYGTWTVRRVITDPHWSHAAAPGDDVAFLVVGKPRSGRSLQSVTGGEGLSLPVDWQPVVAVGYPDGSGDPVACANSTRPFGTNQVEFDCAGYYNGTSGGPLLSDVSPVTGLGVIVGVIGGYQEGGYTNAVSYAARFGPDVSALYDEAVASDA